MSLCRLGPVDKLMQRYFLQEARRGWARQFFNCDLMKASEMEGIAVGIEHPLQSEISCLLAQSDAVAAKLYPGEYRRPITAESLAKPATYVLVARIGEKAMGLCVLFDRGDHTMELKRMIVDEGARGKGIGRALLRRAEAEALRLGARAVLLEVGTRNTDAQVLYRRGGYQSCGPFFPYATSPISLFMRLPLNRPA